MAAPTYTTDLSTLNLCENSGTFGEFTGMVEGGAPDGTDQDDVIQGSYLCSAQCSLKIGELQSIYADYGSGVTVPTDGAILMWNKFDAGGLLAAYASGGVRIVIGASAVNWDAWKAGGVDKTPNPYGGWYNYALNPLARTYDYRGGSGTGTTYRFAGMAISLTAAGPSKGQPFKIDAIRYGRCTIIIEYGSSGDGYANFADAAAKNDNNEATDGYNRWGLFSVSGGGYLWKGRMQIGTTNACEFVASDAFILIDDVVNCTANFNTIEINHASTTVNWTNVIFKALGSTSPGRLVMNANADMTLDTCQFLNMGAFAFGGALSKLLSCVWQVCGQVTQNGATLTDCVFESSSAAVALVADDIDLVTGCTFNSGGTGHAVNLGTIAASLAVDWDNFESGYAAQGGTAANRTILVNVAASQTLTINVSARGSTPTYYNTGSGDVAIVAGAVTVKVTATTKAGVEVENVQVLLLAKDGTGPFPFEDTVTVTNSGTTATVAHTAHGMANGDKIQIKGASLGANNGVFSITLDGSTPDDKYSYTMGSTPGSSPTGTIKATFVALAGLTNGDGEISTSRVYSSDQPVQGWGRKSTSSPLFQTGVLSGSVSSTSGYDKTAVLVLDE